MGYRRASLALRWPEDSEYAGLQVDMRRPSVGATLLARKVDFGASDEVIEKVVEMMGDAMISWNVEHEITGEPLPPSAEGIQAIDSDLMFEILGAWMGAATASKKEREELGKESTSGDISPDQFALMAASSTSLSS